MPFLQGIKCLHSLKAQHHNWKACSFSNYRKALTLLLYFYRLFLVTECVLWIIVLVTDLVVFLSTLQCKQGCTHDFDHVLDPVMFRRSSTVKVLHHFYCVFYFLDRFHFWSLEAPVNLVVSPPSQMYTGAEQCVVTLNSFYLLFCLAALYHMIWVQINHNEISNWILSLIADPWWSTFS